MYKYTLYIHVCIHVFFLFQGRFSWIPTGYDVSIWHEGTVDASRPTWRNASHATSTGVRGWDACLGLCKCYMPHVHVQIGFHLLSTCLSLHTLQPPPPSKNMAYKTLNTRNGLYFSPDVLLHPYFSKQLRSMALCTFAELQYTYRCMYSTAHAELKRERRVRALLLASFNV